MSPWLWRVEARTATSPFSWSLIVDRLNRKTAEDTAEFYAHRYPEWQLRLVDDETAEIVHVEKASAA